MASKRLEDPPRWRDRVGRGGFFGIASALDPARNAAGDRDVRIAGGGATIVASVNAGLIDAFSALGLTSVRPRRPAPTGRRRPHLSETLE
jgi:hypothetical protein